MLCRTVSLLLVIVHWAAGAQHQHQDGYIYEAYSRGPICRPSDTIRYPTSVQEVVSIVKEAIKRGTTVKAFGARHSMTDIICTDGIPISMELIKKSVYNPGDKSGTFGAGNIMYEVGQFLNERGRALKTIPIYGNITVAGAIGTGAHGSTTKFIAAPSDQVIGVTFVDGMGMIRKIKCKASLRAFRVHLGLLGIILDVTFKTEPNYKVLAHNYEMPDKVLTDGTALNYVRDTDEIMMYWFPEWKKVVIVNLTNIDVNTPGEAYSNLVPSDTLKANKLINEAIEDLQKMPPAKAALEAAIGQKVTYRGLIDDGSTILTSPMFTVDGKKLKNPAIGYWNDILASTCTDNGHIQCAYYHGEHGVQNIDMEIAVPLESFPLVVHRIKDILSKTPAIFYSYPMDGLIFRFSGKGDTYMALNQGRATLHVEFIPFKRSNEYEDSMVWLPAQQTILQAMVNEFKGRSHWGKTGFAYHTKEMINNKVNPQAKASFIALMDKYDPHGVFMNKFGRRFRGYGTEMDTDPLTTHCALQDNCICQADTDCAKLQKCGPIIGFKYNVCQNVIPFWG